MFVVCSSCENCAIWPMNSVSFMGSSGFWPVIWLARILRKPSDEKMSVTGFFVAAGERRRGDERHR